MTGPAVQLQPLVRARVEALGEEGRAWVDGLPGLLAELAQRWSLRLGRGLPGGSASYLTTVVRADGTDAVLKLALPEEGPAGHAAALQAADGRGYVRVLETDVARSALLLERLGPSLEQSRLGVGEQLDALAATLLTAWRTPDRPPLDKAGSLVAGIVARRALAGPDHAVAVGLALRLAAGLAHPDPEDLVLVHGDPHPGNLLRVRHPRAGAETGWCFVDPDPFVADRAYDLGVAVRGFSATLLADPSTATTRLWSWCQRVGARSGVDPARVWAWGLVERVSTGLYVTAFGAGRVGEPFLRSASLLAEQGSPGAGAGVEVVGPPSVLPDVGTTGRRS